MKTPILPIELAFHSEALFVFVRPAVQAHPFCSFRGVFHWFLGSALFSASWPHQKFLNFPDLIIDFWFQFPKSPRSTWLWLLASIFSTKGLRSISNFHPKVFGFCWSVVGTIWAPCGTPKVIISRSAVFSKIVVSCLRNHRFCKPGGSKMVSETDKKNVAKQVSLQDFF